ncbi:MarR family winged helix-turn-helix transcriptional regulator [Aliiroseovarius sp.]|uniref:MarR family winged helix-turn-helix transcriptional regulator n=1 Tax=Aliiroseovarius sp. TaxID=1872442 RepID=UPI002629F426|nr:MarR family winged helix-turn-helix transcriptional regulator [Aliiroseovarius sp.]
MTDTPKSDFDLDTFLPYQLSVLAARVSIGFARHYKKAYGISVAEWRVVAHLSRGGAVSVREIHERVNMDKPKVSRAASRLEEAGYVTKVVSSTDRRLVELSLTEKGWSMIADLTPVARRYEKRLLEAIGSEDETFRRLVGSLNEAARDPLIDG